MRLKEPLDQHLDWIISKIHYETVPKYEILYKESEKVSKFYLLLTGKVAIYAKKSTL
jgi:CRP-like cAMP-binding protein